MCIYVKYVFDVSVFGQDMGKLYVTAVYRNFEVETSSSNSFCCYRIQVQSCLPTKMEQGNTVIP